METSITNTIHFQTPVLHLKITYLLPISRYREPAWSGRYLYFMSNLPLIYKKFVILSLADQAILLSHNTFHSRNIQLSKTTLLNSN